MGRGFQVKYNFDDIEIFSIKIRKSQRCKWRIESEKERRHGKGPGALTATKDLNNQLITGSLWRY
jgi:hypothetical protein